MRRMPPVRLTVADVEFAESKVLPACTVPPLTFSVVLGPSKKLPVVVASDDPAPLTLPTAVAPATALIDRPAVVTCPPPSTKRVPLPVKPTLMVLLFVHLELA